jgi:hypothetical protein
MGRAVGSNSGTWAAFDLACSLASEAEAVAAVTAVLQQGEPSAPTPAELLLGEAVAASGMTTEQFDAAWAEADRRFRHAQRQRQ